MVISSGGSKSPVYHLELGLGWVESWKQAKNSYQKDRSKIMSVNQGCKPKAEPRISARGTEAKCHVLAVSQSHKLGIEARSLQLKRAGAVRRASTATGIVHIEKPLVCCGSQANQELWPLC